MVLINQVTSGLLEAEVVPDKTLPEEHLELAATDPQDLLLGQELVMVDSHHHLLLMIQWDKVEMH
jgi:hypothetical protein